MMIDVAAAERPRRLPPPGRRRHAPAHRLGDDASTCEGRVNLAPFSFFNAFGANPPVVVFSPTLRRDGSQKDTLCNVEATGEFVLNAAVEALAEQVNLSSKELPSRRERGRADGPDPAALAEGEAAAAGRVAGHTWSAGCCRSCRSATGRSPANLVIGEVVVIHVDDARPRRARARRPAEAADHRPARRRLLLPERPTCSR